jgi:septal ring factor EnvC (AmiA/AmiB activator)
VLNRRAQTRLRGRVAIYVAGGASLLAFCAALAVLDVERSSTDANITDFGETVAAEKEQAEDLQATVRRLEAKLDRLAAQESLDPSPRRRRDG